LSRVVIDPLQVRGLSAQTWTVVHQLAVNFARRKIDERHFVLTRFSSKTYSTRATPVQMCCTRFSRPSTRHRKSSPPHSASLSGSTPAVTLPEGISLRLPNRRPLRAAIVVSATTPILAQPIFARCSRLVTPVPIQIFDSDTYSTGRTNSASHSGA
jgi:hypothetical protein